jgi:CxxC motif-containing protein (DUF1111 family)
VLAAGDAVPGDETDPTTGALVRLSTDAVGAHGEPVGDPVYGRQLQDRALAGSVPEGRIVVTYTDVPGTFVDGTPFTLRRPTYSIAGLSRGPLATDTRLSVRLAPPVVGAGLLEAIPESDIVARADPDDRNGDGVRGIANQVWDARDERMTLGRFGWKAGQPTVAQQTAGALFGDMGVTSPLVNESAVDGGAPDIDGRAYDDLVLYTQALAVPAMRDVDNEQVRAGATTFVSVGCASCHTPKQRTGESEVSGLTEQTIHPFTDLLVHDMGEGLADGTAEFDAGGRAWRTPPLWTIGLTPIVGRGREFYLHDGRARTVSEAILWHDGEAAIARERYRNLPAADRAALERFLRAL